MPRFIAFTAVLSLTAGVLSQAVEPSAPPKIVSQHAQDILSSSESSPCQNACAQIALKLPAEHLLFSPNEINYIWSAQQGELTPACRALPTTAEEVSSILSIAKETKCHFAVKSGGHFQHAGASTASKGITIDLAKMNRVDVSKNRLSVSVGAGAQWADVYRAVEKEDLLVVGGRVADVGVGGLLTGGGISLLSGKYGWACDNVLLFEVVLPNGNITKVDQGHHPELYRALRGAGFSNFGIITSFTLEASVPANPKGFWTGFHIFDTGKLPTLLDQQATMLSDMVAEDMDAAYLHSYGYDVKHDSALAITIHFHGSHSDPSTFPAIFEYTSKLEPLMERSVSIKPYSDITKMLYDFNPLPGKRNLFVSFSHVPSPELEERMTNLFYNAIVPKIKNISGIVPNMVMQPIFAEQRRSKRGGNAFGFDEGPALNLVLLPWTWELAEDDEFIHAMLKQILDTSEAWAKELGVYHPFIYPNYAGPWQDIWRGYGEENVKELKKLQRRYDPENIFTKGGLASGGFKLNAKDGDLDEGSPIPANSESKDEL